MDSADTVRIDLGAARECTASEPRLRGQGSVHQLQAVYEQQGPERLLAGLHGGFALVLPDRRSGRILIARDRLGIEPVYWRKDGDTLLVGSRMRDILASVSSPKIDRDAVAQFLAFGCIPHPRSLIEGIHKLPPGHFIEMDPAGDLCPESRPYWQPSFRHPSSQPATEDVLRRVDDLLCAAVSRSAEGCTPGVLLSGGIDSALILAELASCHRRAGRSERIQTFTIGFMEPGYTELAAARQIAHHHRADHHELLLTFGDFTRALPGLAEAYDEPIGSPSAVPEYLLSRFAAQRMDVVLSGEGADELFAGYPKYAADGLSRYLDWMPDVVRGRLLRGAAAIVPGRQRSIRQALVALALADPTERCAGWINPADGMGELLADDLRQRLGASASVQRLREELDACDSEDALDRLLHCEMRIPLPEGVLLRMRRTRDACGLRWGAPFLDEALVDYAASLPAVLKTDGRNTKLILRTLARRHAAHRPIHRRKMNFSVPMEMWLAGPMRAVAADLLLNDAAIARGYCNPDALRRMLTGRSRTVTVRGIWGLMALELWHRAIEGCLEDAPPPGALRERPSSG